ncbi:bestrophin family ion channel [Sphingobacterium sp. DR205]|uniref:bestrophin family protein n=1 Tax=Sphingobacterium sp. DR205 TaxID=2713573 RepID=UPI0013E41CAB|nr:bestrophin family ion channel [Sphingobacterium sp. DR205]QIH32718.1 multidrug transporter [Sphingobacterium sp. DR205]
MYIGRTYKITEFLFWTRRNLFLLLLISIVPVLMYELLGLQWLVVPWPIVAFLGTATAFVVGFKNQQTYNRTWEARDIWGLKIGMSRAWAIMCRDFIKDRDIAREIAFRHLAWLTLLRYELRSKRAWENIDKSYNREYASFYTIPEREIALSTVLQKYIRHEELEEVISSSNPLTQLMSLQSAALARLSDTGALDNSRFFELHKYLREFSTLQARSEKIKNFPYPRQYATVNRIFVWLFCLLLPFAMLKEFNSFNEFTTGWMRGHMVWLVIPFSMIISWVYTSLDQVGESTENPFEGGPNDIPISHICYTLENEIRDIWGDARPAQTIVNPNNIIM